MAIYLDPWLYILFPSCMVFQPFFFMLLESSSNAIDDVKALLASSLHFLLSSGGFVGILKATTGSKVSCSSDKDTIKSPFIGALVVSRN